jgi:hypothetical protein
MQGVPSGSTSGGSTAKQVSLILIRQQLKWIFKVNSVTLAWSKLCSPLARILNHIAHATLQTLRLTIRHTLSIPTLTSLLANRSIRHRRRLGTLGAIARTPRLLFARRVLGLPTLDSVRNELTILAARRILVAANGSLVATQLTVLVTARIVVFGAQQTGVALLVALHTQIAAE